MSSLWEVQSVLNKVKNVVLNYTEMEAKVREATSNETWGASGTLMQEISQGTHNYQYFTEIMTTIHRRFTEKEARHWRQIYKALTLLEYLVKNGAERVVDDARSHLSTIKYLKNFAYIDEKGKDQGSNVRNRAKELVDLLSDTDRIKDERKKAKANKNKYTGVSSDMGSSAYGGGGGNRYGGFGSESLSVSGRSGGGYTDTTTASTTSPIQSRYDDYTSSPTSAVSNRHPSFSDEKSTAMRPKIHMTSNENVASSSNANRNLFEFDEPAPSNKSGDDWAGFSSASGGAGGDDFGDFQAVPTAVSNTNGPMDMFATFPPPQQHQQQQQQQTNFSAQQPFGGFANFGNSAPFGGSNAGPVGGNLNTMDLLGSPPKSASGFPAQSSYQVNTPGSADNDAWAAFAKPPTLPSVNTGTVPTASGFSTAAAAGKSEIWSKNINLVSLDSLGQRIANKDKTGPSLNALSTPTSQSGPGFGGMGLNNVGGMGMGQMGAQPPLSAGHLGGAGMASAIGMGNIGHVQRPGTQHPMMMNGGGQWGQQAPPVQGQNQPAQGQMSFF